MRVLRLILAVAILMIAGALLFDGIVIVIGWQALLVSFGITVALFAAGYAVLWACYEIGRY